MAAFVTFEERNVESEGGKDRFLYIRHCRPSFDCMLQVKIREFLAKNSYCSLEKKERKQIYLQVVFIKMFFFQGTTQEVKG